MLRGGWGGGAILPIFDVSEVSVTEDPGIFLVWTLEFQSYLEGWFQKVVLLLYNMKVIEVLNSSLGLVKE